MLNGPLKEALTFDDVMLLPAHSKILPKEVDISTTLSNGLKLNLPIISAAMDTVTESKMAIALAQQGGLGIVHRNMSIHNQTAEIEKVKRSESGMVTEPITMSPNQKIRDALEIMSTYHISGVPVTEKEKLVGIGPSGSTC